MRTILASPFVPGIATGELRLHCHACPNAILLLSFTDLEYLSERPAGLIIIAGAPLAHPMIRLYSYGIPTVIVSHAQALQLQEGERVTIDGFTGLINDTYDTDSPSQPEPVTPTTGQPVYTVDGTAIELRASIADHRGAATAVEKGASAIGMVRSEFLVPSDGSTPDELYYYNALRQLCKLAGPLPVTVRTLDLAPDKHPSWLGEVPGMSGPLGLRGSRLYAQDPVKSVFLAELYALARLAPEHELRLLLPYLTRTEEFAALRKEVRSVIPSTIPLGAMIETPAAALALLDWLRLVDFVVIGCNDLMQCLFAADRDNPAVAPLLDPYSPILFRFLRQMAHSAKQEQNRIQLGGLLSQIPGLLPVLIGLGFRNFSVEPLLTPCLAQLCHTTETTAAEQLAGKVCAATSTKDVRKLLNLPAELIWGGKPDRS